MKLSARQRREFDEQGYSNLGSMFDERDLSEIGAEYDRLVRSDGQVLGNERDGFFPYRAMLHFRSPTLRRYINHPEVVELMLDLIGPDVRLWWEQGINKGPGAGSFIAWHQDNGYQRGRVPEYKTLWLALDDSDLENGGLMVIPGSHRRGDLPHSMQGVHAVIDAGHVDAENAVALDAKAGDVLLFSSLLVHQTVGNGTTDRNRRAWVMQYTRGDARNAVTGERYDDRVWVARGGEVVAEPWSERRFDLHRDRP